MITLHQAWGEKGTNEFCCTRSLSLQASDEAVSALNARQQSLQRSEVGEGLVFQEVYAAYHPPRVYGDDLSFT